MISRTQKSKGSGLIFPIRVSSVIESGGVCPYEIEFKTACGKWGYLRYRSGFLRCGIAKDAREFYRNWNYNVINEKIGDDLDGWPDDKLFKEKLDGKLVFPNDFKFEHDHSGE